jgi:hypothetical protein
LEKQQHTWRAMTSNRGMWNRILTGSKRAPYLRSNLAASFVIPNNPKPTVPRSRKRPITLFVLLRLAFTSLRKKKQLLCCCSQIWNPWWWCSSSCSSLWCHSSASHFQLPSLRWPQLRHPFWPTLSIYLATVCIALGWDWSYLQKRSIHLKFNPSKHLPTVSGYSRTGRREKWWFPSVERRTEATTVFRLSGIDHLDLHTSCGPSPLVFRGWLVGWCLCY